MSGIKIFQAQAGSSPPQGSSPSKTPPIPISNMMVGIAETSEQGGELHESGSYYIVNSFANSADNSLQRRPYQSEEKKVKEEDYKPENSITAFVNISLVESKSATKTSLEQSFHEEEGIDGTLTEASRKEEELEEDKENGGPGEEREQENSDTGVKDFATNVVEVGREKVSDDNYGKGRDRLSGREERENDSEQVGNAATNEILEVPSTLAPVVSPNTLERETDIVSETLQATESGSTEETQGESPGNRTQTLTTNNQLTHSANNHGTAGIGREEVGGGGSESLFPIESRDGRDQETSSTLSKTSSTCLQEVQCSPQETPPQNTPAEIFTHSSVYCWLHIADLQRNDHFVATKKLIIDKSVDVKILVVPNMDHNGVCWHEIHIQTTVKGDMLKRIRLGVATPEIATETTVYDMGDGQILGGSSRIHENHKFIDSYLNYSCRLMKTASLHNYRKSKLKVKIDFKLYPKYLLRTQLDHQDEVVVISQLM